MESLTKNKQSRMVIDQMVSKAFNNLSATHIIELKEGFFNIAYLIGLADGTEAILKIAPPADSLIMTHEKDIMYAEVDSMRLVKAKTSVPVAEILFYDQSHSICDSDYFFMSKLEGDSLNSISNQLTEEDKKSIHFTTGKYNAEINHITEKKFGYYNQADKQGDDWFTVFSSILQDVVNDAKKLQISIGVKYDVIGNCLEAYRSCFTEVTVPQLVHWDLWAGNVFIKDKKVTGLIDFERCLWGDVLMEVGFRSDNQNDDFLHGYGISKLSELQQIRVKWYDLYLFLICSLECDYRKYSDYNQLHWAQNKIRSSIDFLRQNA